MFGGITGNLWLQTGEEKVDLGLCVKHGAKGLCVPDYVQAQPDNNGWAYSQALVTVIEQYKVCMVSHTVHWIQCCAVLLCSVLVVSDVHA